MSNIVLARTILTEAGSSKSMTKDDLQRTINRALSLMVRSHAGTKLGPSKKSKSTKPARKAARK